ncbi:unnamed protein product [Symbiodinium natans]|uniref:Calcineurin-like phosphoesterase domain-containing protein n=1 Tax=Symbiodinium natans TaxID=878477 RepID=A0A812MDU2_9DINO|nr:unnamed protein product [Symbiodinium natans]
MSVQLQDKEGQSLSSAALSPRLATGTVVREVQVAGDRLQFTLVEGDGPAEGWASLHLKGKPLFEKCQGEPSESLAAVRRGAEALTAPEDWPNLGCSRLLAWSDLHVDMGENQRFLEGVGGDGEAAVILCGDLCTNLELLRSTLELCVSRFRAVFYVPGNHELWVARDARDPSQQATSFTKFLDILRLCAECGVHTKPAFIAPGVAVCPLFSWYQGDFSGVMVPHGGFDSATFWPELADDPHNPQDPQIATFFRGLNDARVAQAANLRKKGELTSLWTFSHFLPRKELNMSGEHAVMPPGVAGDPALDLQLRAAGAVGHVYGHSHIGQDRVYEGVRYVQQPLGYPTDGHREERPLQLFDAAQVALGPAAAPSTGVDRAQLSAERVRGALFGALCGDALAMPVCWYYGGQRQIKRDYGGPLTGYVKPKEQLIGSFMMNEALPKAIDHGRSRYYRPVNEQSPSIGYHYHRGLPAGGLTLEGQMIRLLMRAVAENKGALPSPDDLRARYVAFMKDGSHGDTWVSKYHREFFAQLEKGTPAPECAARGDPVETMEMLSIQMPIFLACLGGSEEEDCQRILASIASLRNPGNVAQTAVRLLRGAFCQIFNGQTLEEVAERMAVTLLPGQAGLESLLQGRKDPMASTSIEECFPSMMHYLFRYGRSFEELLLAQSNVGGETVHRGAILGALAGATAGRSSLPDAWCKGLADFVAIDAEVESFVQAVCDAAGSPVGT